MKKYAVLALLLYTIASGALTGCGQEKDIGQETAKKIALEHAQVLESDVSNIQISRGDEDGAKTYNIEFALNNREYEYEIAAADGKIINADQDLNDPYEPFD